MTLRDLMMDSALFGGEFGNSAWAAWRAFACALFGITPHEAGAADIIRRCTGRSTLPTFPAREGWLVVGRRGGKSRIAALLAVFLACFRKYRLASGERGVVMVIAADRRQARVVFRYVRGLFASLPMLSALITRETKESLDLSNGITIEVHTASFRAIRGYTVVGAICDEIAFWPTDDAAAESDAEILHALRPAMATVPDALLLAISSPYARRGELWRMYDQYFGREDSDILVWQADTRTMNSSVPERSIADAYAADEAIASAEYGAQFRRDIERFLAREVLDALVVAGRYELPPLGETTYVGFVDPSGGSADSFTLAIAHHDDVRDRAVVDVVREVRPPFSPEQVVEDFATLLHGYRVDEVTGDRYAGEWPREQFRKHGLTYTPCEEAKSDLYRDLLPLLNSARVELLDHPTLLAQLTSLERRTARGGRDSIDHAPRAHDDVANAVAGALVRASTQPAPLIFR